MNHFIHYNGESSRLSVISRRHEMLNAHQLQLLYRVHTETDLFIRISNIDDLVCSRDICGWL